VVGEETPVGPGVNVATPEMGIENPDTSIVGSRPARQGFTGGLRVTQSARRRAPSSPIRRSCPSRISAMNACAVNPLDGLSDSPWSAQTRRCWRSCSGTHAASCGDADLGAQVDPSDIALVPDRRLPAYVLGNRWSWDSCVPNRSLWGTLLHDDTTENAPFEVGCPTWPVPVRAGQGDGRGSPMGSQGRGPPRALRAAPRCPRLATISIDASPNRGKRCWVRKALGSRRPDGVGAVGARGCEPPHDPPRRLTR